MKKELTGDVQKMHGLWNKMQDLHKEVFDELAWMSRQMKLLKCPYALPELADLGFLCREMENLLDDWRKDCKARKEFAGKLLARGVLDCAEADGDLMASDTVRGSLATAAPDVYMIAELPKAGTPEFAEFCSFYGVPKDLAASKTFPLSIHWKKAQEDLQERAALGRPTPPGLGKKYPQYFAVFTRHRSKKD